MRNLNIILRSIFRQKLNSGIMLISLAIGLACINLILLFLSRELSTDGFHENEGPDIRTEM